MTDTMIDCSKRVVDWSSLVTYGVMRPNEFGGKSLKVNVGRGPLRITTPFMDTWGISAFVDPSGVSDGKYSLPFRFPPPNVDKSCDMFLSNLRDLEKKMMHDIFENSLAWVGEKYSNETVIPYVYNSFLKMGKGKNADMPPTLRAKAPRWEDKWRMDVFDERGSPLFLQNSPGEQTPEELVPIGARAMGVLQCGGLWLVNGKFSMTWRLVQVVVKPPERLAAGQCYLVSSSNDVDEEGGVVVDNSDDEDEPDAVEAAAASDVVESSPPSPPPSDGAVVSEVLAESVEPTTVFNVGDKKKGKGKK